MKDRWGKIQKGKWYSALIFLFIFLILTGNVISNKHIRLFGVVLSAYRVFLPVLFLVILGKWIQKRELKTVLDNRILLIYLGMIFAWMIWGVGLMLISPYVDMRSALQDLLSLFLAFISISCFWEICNSDNILEKIFQYIRIVCIILCAIAFIEILTGFFMPFSKYCWLDVVNPRDWYVVVLQSLKDASLYPTTTIFHNINDFSVFLAIFLPLFYIDKNKSKRENIFRGVGFICIVFVLSVNDSNIALIGVVMSAVFYFILYVERKYAGGIFAVLFAFLSFGNKAVTSLLITIKSMLPYKIPSTAEKYGSVMELNKISQLNSVTEVLEVQMTDALAGSTNSLMCRWQITWTSLRMVLESKFIGVGPSAFENYIKENEPTSLLLNPHNWWLEILSQYGIIIFLAYLSAMLYIFINVFKVYKKYKNNYILLYLCMCITFCVACIAPSSYLRVTYQWLLPAIGIGILKIYPTEKKSEARERGYLHGKK